MYSEIFALNQRELGKDFEKILAKVYYKQKFSVDTVGFKVFYYHLTDEEWEKLLSNKELKIIHLTRKNRLRTIISLDMAFMTNKWSSEGLENKNNHKKKVVIDTNTLLTRLEEIENYESIMRARISNHKVIEIEYETLTTNPDYVFSQLGEFIGVNDVDPKRINLKKQNPGKVEDLVENYAEVFNILESTKFSSYLD